MRAYRAMLPLTSTRENETGFLSIRYVELDGSPPIRLDLSVIPLPSWENVYSASNADPSNLLRKQLLSLDDRTEEDSFLDYRQ